DYVINEMVNVKDDLKDGLEQTIKVGNVKRYGARGDGVTDDTEAIQSTIDHNNYIYFPEGTYYFKNLVINKDNTKIEFAPNVIIKSDYNLNEHFGTIDISGSLDKSVYPEEDVKSGDSEIVLNGSDIALFNKGDYIYIQQTTPSGNDLESLRKKYLSCLMKVKKIIGTTLILEGSLPYSFNVDNDFRIKKANVIKGVEIKGSNTKFDHMGVVGKQAFLHANLTIGFKISGFHMTNSSNRSVYITRSNDFIVEEFETSNHLRTKAGYGYGVTIESGSGHGRIRDIITNGARHGVDICGGSHEIVIERVIGYDTDVLGHGENYRI